MNGVEKRQQERYSLHIPVKINLNASNKEISAGIFTKNISSKGVFINSPIFDLQPGGKVHLEMTLTIDKLKKLFGCSEKTILEVDGSIIRSMDKGMAIEFDKNYSIFPEILRTN